MNGLAKSGRSKNNKVDGQVDGSLIFKRESGWSRSIKVDGPKLRKWTVRNLPV